MKSEISVFTVFVEATFSCHGLHYMNECIRAKYIITCAADGMGGEYYCARVHVRTPCVSLGHEQDGCMQCLRDGCSALREGCTVVLCGRGALQCCAGWVQCFVEWVQCCAGWVQCSAVRDRCSTVLCEIVHLPISL